MHLFTHYAYLDPGTGSLLIQSIIGVVAGIALFGRRTLASLFGKLRKRDKASPLPDED